MKAQTIIIDKKRFAVIPEKEYITLLEDLEDIKKVFRRKKERGIEAIEFFEKLRNKRKS